MSSTGRLQVGLHFNAVKDIQKTLDHASFNECEYIVVPLFHPRHRRDANTTEGLLTRSDMALSSKAWSRNVVGTISEWVDLDNPALSVRKKAEKIVNQEFQWASHLGLQAVIFPIPSARCPNYCRTIRHFCDDSCHQQIWVRLPRFKTVTSLRIV